MSSLKQCLVISSNITRSENEKYMAIPILQNDGYLCSFSVTRQNDRPDKKNPSPCPMFLSLLDILSFANPSDDFNHCH